MANAFMFKSAEDLQNKIDEYFIKAIAEDEIPDVEGLAAHLDTTRKTLLDYEKNHGDEELSYTIKKAKDKILYYKKQGAYKGKYNATVFIFDAKNNHGYTDKQEIESKNVNQNENKNIDLSHLSVAELKELLGDDN